MEHGKPCAQYGLSGSEYVISQTDARLKIEQGRLVTRQGHAAVNCMPQQASVPRRVRGVFLVSDYSILSYEIVGIAVVISCRIPDLNSLRQAIPLTNVVKPQAVIQGQLPIRLKRILGINGPLVELHVVNRDGIGLCVVGRVAS